MSDCLACGHELLQGEHVVVVQAWPLLLPLVAAGTAHVRCPPEPKQQPIIISDSP